MDSLSELNLNPSNSDAKRNSERHCAFCLQRKPYKVCGGCRKRAYCSVGCQKNDWTTEGIGQGHKSWCKFDCGEEDVDWEVRSIPCKGLGLVAKRFIPSKYKIIVEGVHCNPDSHPAILALTPEDGTLQQKFENNELGGDMKYQGGKNYVALRISRANHSCSPNAAHDFCESSKCEILYACQDIQEGDEICISYRLLTNIRRHPGYIGLTTEEEFQIIKDTIRASWKFSCSEDCVCNSKLLPESVSKARNLYAMFKRVAHSDPASALRLIDPLLTAMNLFNASWIAKANVHYEAYDVAIQNPALLKEAIGHIRTIYEIYAAISPISKDNYIYKTKLEMAIAMVEGLHRCRK